MAEGKNSYRAVRVFLASTFQDMEAERELLVKRTFPRLQRYCEARGVIWTEIDLRWGIPEDEIERGKLLQRCFRAIDHCRPFFVGLLGERYGSTIPRIPPEVQSENPWLAGLENRSITELELRYALLNPRSSSESGRVFIRATEASESEPESANNAEQMSALKHEVRTDLGHITHTYDSLATLDELVFSQLAAEIDGRFPKVELGDELDQLRHEQAAFEATRSHGFVAVPELEQLLKTFQEVEMKPLVLFGPPGSGKSTLMAHWLRGVPERASVFIGADRKTTDWRYVVALLESAIRVTAPSEGLRDLAFHANPSLSRVLQVACRDKTIVVAIDGLNHLDPVPGALQLAWLPRRVPVKTRLIVTTSSQSQVDELSARGWNVVPMHALAPAAREQMIRQRLLEDREKDIGDFWAQTIAEQPEMQHPLYLRLILDELKCYGGSDPMKRFVDCINEPHEGTPGHRLPAVLYRNVIRRVARDLTAKEAETFYRILFWLRICKHGLREREILQLVGKRFGPESKSMLFHTLATGLVRDSTGLILIENDHVGEAVDYLVEFDADAESRWLAEQLWDLPRSARNASEIAWHLTRVRDWNRLADLLDDESVLQQLAHRDLSLLATLWSRLETFIGRSLASATDHISKEEHVSAATLDALGSLLRYAGHERRGLQTLRRLETHARHGHRRIGLDAHAMLLIEVGDLSTARRILHKSLAITPELELDDSAARTLRVYARLEEMRLKGERAYSLIRLSEVIAEDDGHPLERAKSLVERGRIDWRFGDPDQGLAYCARAESISRSLGYAHVLLRSLATKLLILLSMGRSEEAWQVATLARETASQSACGTSLPIITAALSVLNGARASTRRHADELMLEATSLANRSEMSFDSEAVQFLGSLRST